MVRCVQYNALKWSTLANTNAVYDKQVLITFIFFLFFQYVMTSSDHIVHATTHARLMANKLVQFQLSARKPQIMEKSPSSLLASSSSCILHVASLLATFHTPG
jgi:hypothetical protein